MSRRQLARFQAAVIERTLSGYGVSGRVVRSHVLPRFIRHDFAAGMDVRVNKIVGLAEEVARGLGVQTVRAQRDRAVVQFQIPTSIGGALKIKPLLDRAGGCPPGTALLGLDETGVPLVLRLPAPDVVHVLVVGTTGSGKTALMRAMALSLATWDRPARLAIALIDPKGRGLSPLAGLPHLLRPPARRLEEALLVLAEIVDEVDRRNQGASGPRLVLFVDELADLLAVSKAAGEMITRLAQTGREAGVHLVAATQKPTVDAVGSLTKANFPVRLVGTVTSPEEAKVASGLRATGAENLAGQGDFLLCRAGHKPLRFLAPLCLAEDYVWPAAARSPQPVPVSRNGLRKMLRLIK